jgi:hypothetical protein
MGYKTKSMLKAVGRNYEPKQQIIQGTRPQAGAYSRGNKDFSAVKSAINIPDSFEDAATALGTKIGERKLTQTKEEKEEARRKKIERQSARAKKNADRKFIKDKREGEIKFNEKVNDLFKRQATDNPVAESLLNDGVDLTQDYEVSRDISKQTINQPWNKNPFNMAAPDAFEKAMKRKARYKK